MTSSPPTNIQTPQTLQSDVARRLKSRINYTPEEQLIIDTINKWRSELMNPSKYGDILGIGFGTEHEASPIRISNGKYISILIKHTNELTANIPTCLDGIPVKVIDTRGGIVAAIETYQST